ncbi:MAG: PQQ-binding-like beta-propeller repeat protein, partial [Psychromonas sp.]|nr:PQQ-binding-like beta-propeller repeat protein [Psychromonas sp.]
SGELRWEDRVATPKGETEIERIVDVDGAPAVTKNKLFAVSYQGRVVAYDLQSGKSMWAEDESSYRDVAIGFANVYISNSESDVVAYDQQDGNIKWVQEGLLRRKITSPSVISSYVVVADYDGYIHLLSQVDGSFAARTRINGSGVKTAILADGSRFYVLANNGKLKAYELGDEINK